MKKFKMDCGVYCNSTGFKVGRKYLTLIEAYTNKVLDRLELTPSIINELESIKEKYRYDDARRTYNVMSLFDC